MSRAYVYANSRWEESTGDPSIGPGYEQAAPGNHNHDTPRKTFARLSQDYFTGGGVVSWNNSNQLGWTQRFIGITTGHDANLLSNGHFNIDQQTSGAVTVVGGASARNWGANGIVLNNGETLWYIIPFGAGGASPQLTVPANFRLSGRSADFTPGDDWVVVASADDELIRLCNGRHLSRFGNSQISPDTGWIAPTLQNGWVNYDAYWENAAYRRMNGMVYLRGLVRSGTVGYNIPIFTLPVGFRPATDMHDIAGYANPVAVTPLNIFANGVVGQNTGSNGYLTLQTAPFPAAYP